MTFDTPKDMHPQEVRDRSTVSFPTEELILVDHEDHVTGHASKQATHEGAGRLHRAFSVFLFSPDGRVLLHKRGGEKPLWPGYWTNSCCSHPRRSEELLGAVKRRVLEELGVPVITPTHIYAFEYHATFEDRGSEHEYCHVFLGRVVDPSLLSPHAEEIEEWSWLTPQDVDAFIRENPESVTPWFVQEWSALRGEHREVLEAFLSDPEGSRNVA